MNNPTLFDRLTGQIPGKTEKVSILALVMNTTFAILCAFGIVCLSAEMVASLNGAILALLGATLGSRVTRTETTINQIQASQPGTAQDRARESANGNRPSMDTEKM